MATNEMHISVNKTKRAKPSKYIKVTDLVKLIFGKKKIKIKGKKRADKLGQKLLRQMKKSFRMKTVVMLGE